MRFTAEERGESDTIRFMAKGLGVFDPQNEESLLRERIIAEYVRETLLDLSVGNGGAPKVHVLRFLSRVRRQLAPFFPGAEVNAFTDEGQAYSGEEGGGKQDLFRLVLDHLNLLREVEHVGEGYYLPTPLRLVNFPHSAGGTVLVIGGVPTVAAARVLGREPKGLGIARAVLADQLGSATEEDEAIWQPFDRWLGRPSQPTERWTEEFLKERSQRLSDSSEDFDSFEVYEPFRNRWDQASEWKGAAEGLYLCRRGGYGTPRRFWLGLFRDTGAGPRLEKEAGVTREEARRLVHGLARLAGRPVRFEWAKKGNQAEFIIRHPLPEGESRLLCLLVGPGAVPAGAPPWRYPVPERWRRLVDEVFSELGVVIDKGNSGG
jgi:hypothetical protein